MIIVMIVGFVGFLIGAVVQWLNMRDTVNTTKKRERYWSRKHIPSLIDQFKRLANEAHDMSHDKDFTDKARKDHIVAAEIWNRAAQCAEYKLEDEKAYGSLRDEN